MSILQDEIAELPAVLQPVATQTIQALIAEGVDAANEIIRQVLAGNWEPAYKFMESQLHGAALDAAQAAVNVEWNANITAEEAKRATWKAIFTNIIQILIAIGLAAL
jgi:hypothetical protein